MRWYEGEVATMVLTRLGEVDDESVIMWIARNGHATSSQMARAFGHPAEQVRRQCLRLMADGRVALRDGRWVLTGTGEKEAARVRMLTS